MKKSVSALSILAAMSLLAATLYAAGQGRTTRQVANFEAITVGGGIDLHVRQGQSFLVEVEAPGRDVADIVTEVRNGTLEVRSARTWFGFFDWGRDQGAVYVTLPKLVSLTASGGSDVKGEGTIAGDKLELTTSGGSDVTLNVAVATLNVRTSGGSDVNLTGSARSTSMRSSGGSDLDASRLTADTADLASSGGADMSIEVRETIVANASGGSEIRYGGEPRNVNVNASGGGDVRRR